MDSTFQTWVRQPTTMLGLAMIVSAFLMALFGLIPVAMFVCVLMPALGLVGVNDNTAAAEDAKMFATDVIASVTTNHLTENLPRLLGEAMRTATDLTKKTATVIVLIVAMLALNACGIKPPEIAVAPVTAGSAAGQASVPAPLAATVPLSSLLNAAADDLVGAFNAAIVAPPDGPAVTCFGDVIAASNAVANATSVSLPALAPLTTLEKLRRGSTAGAGSIIQLKATAVRDCDYLGIDTINKGLTIPESVAALLAGFQATMFTAP